MNPSQNDIWQTAVYRDAYVADPALACGHLSGISPLLILRVGPFAGDQAAVPAQDSAGRNQPVSPQPCRQKPDQRGEDRPVCPVEPGPGIRAAQNGDLVPQYKQTRRLGGR
jgi:hypothetical protein